MPAWLIAVLEALAPQIIPALGALLSSAVKEAAAHTVAGNHNAASGAIATALNTVAATVTALTPVVVEGATAVLAAKLPQAGTGQGAAIVVPTPNRPL